MKRTAIVMLLALFALGSVSCGSASTPSDTTPREVKVIALTGTLMAFVANASARDAVFNDLVVDADSGTITTPIEKTYSVLGLEGTDDDTLTVNSGSWTRSTASGVTTVTLTDIDYTSEMIEYPWNNTTPFAGAVVEFDNIDYTVTASTDSSNITGLLTNTFKGTGALTSLTYTENTVTSDEIDIGTMTVNILEPTAKTGTVSFDSPVFGGSVENGHLTSSAVLTSTVVYEGDGYSCTILAIFTPATVTSPGNTGIGELEVTSANCTAN